MLTLTWIDEQPVLFDKTEFSGFGWITLTLFGNEKTTGYLSVEEFDRGDFVEVGNCKLMKVLYGL